MNELNECLKYFNLAYTETLDLNEYYGKDIDIDNIDIDTTNCISLYNLIYSINKMHCLFKKEYEELEKLDLGDDIKILGFNKFEHQLRVLDMLVYKPKMLNTNYTYLYLREVNGVSMPYITNEISIHSDNGFYRKTIKLPAKTVKKYLDLFEKYELLLKLYKYLNNRIIFNDGTYMLYTRIESTNDGILNDFVSFKIGMDENHFMKPGSHININVNLRNDFSIDLERCNVALNENEISLNSDEYVNILKNTYINGKYLIDDKIKDAKKSDNVKVLINNL